MNTPTVVLVHGAWHGAWCWQRVVPRLQQAGVGVHAVTLTGVADRAHLMAPGIRLSTHVQDVLGLITAFELERVVLVGHSYGGIVITGVADQLQQSQPGRVAALVYVDAVTPHPGESWSSMHAPETVAQRLTELPLLTPMGQQITPVAASASGHRMPACLASLVPTATGSTAARHHSRWGSTRTGWTLMRRAWPACRAPLSTALHPPCPPLR